MSNPERPDSVTAIDILLHPDDIMLEHARAVNARLIDAYPDGFTLDAAHQPHITMLQRFVGTADLDKVYAASEIVFASENPATWTLRAVKHYYIPSGPIGLAGIVVEPNRGSAQAPATPDRCDRAIHRRGRNRRRICQRPGRPGYPGVVDPVRIELCARLLGRQVQSARLNWGGHSSLFGRDVG